MHNRTVCQHRHPSWLIVNRQKAGLLACEHPCAAPSRLPSGILRSMPRLQLRDSTGFAPVSHFMRTFYRTLSAVMFLICNRIITSGSAAVNESVIPNCYRKTVSSLLCRSGIHAFQCPDCMNEKVAAFLCEKCSSPLHECSGDCVEGNTWETLIDLIAFHRRLTGAPMRSAALTGRGSSFKQAYHNPKSQTGASSPGG